MTAATFRTGHTVLVHASRHQVWWTLTQDVAAWWPTVSRRGAASALLEPFVGGRILEDQTLHPWGRVTGWCPSGYLEVRGRMGLPAGVTGLLEVELDETPDGTLLHVLHQVAGPWESARWVRSTDAWRGMAEQVGRCAEQSRRPLVPVLAGPVAVGRVAAGPVLAGRSGLRLAQAGGHG